MERPLRVAIWVGGTLVLLFALFTIPPLWNYTSWYPKVWSARVMVDGTADPSFRLYADVRRAGAVIVRRETGALDAYFLGLMPDGHSFVWRCEPFAFSFLPGLAYSNHIQFGKGCMAGNLGVGDEKGNLGSKPEYYWNPALKVEPRSIEFTTRDGKRVRAVW